MVYEADKNGDIFHINNGENNPEENEERGISYNEEGNNVIFQEEKEEKKDEVNNDAMSTSLNSSKNEISEFNNIPKNSSASGKDEEEPDSIIIHTICVNNPNINNNIMINPEENFDNESNEESHNIFNNENEITQNGTNNQEHE